MTDPRTRLSMKLLWKLYVDFIEETKRDDGSMNYLGANNFLLFIESEMKPPKKPLLTNKEVL